MGTYRSLIDEPRSHAVEFLDRPRTIIRAADIEPVPVEAPHGHVLLRLQEIEHQGVEPVWTTLGDEVHGPPADHVNAHADLVFGRRLLLKPGEPPCAVRDQHS